MKKEEQTVGVINKVNEHLFWVPLQVIQLFFKVHHFNLKISRNEKKI